MTFRSSEATFAHTFAQDVTFLTSPHYYNDVLYYIITLISNEKLQYIFLKKIIERKTLTNHTLFFNSLHYIIICLQVISNAFDLVRWMNLHEIFYLQVISKAFDLV